MEQRSALVEVNLLEFEPHEQQLHYELPIRDLLVYAARRGLEHYGIYHGSSHLIAYRPERAGGARAARNLARVAGERVRRRVRPR
jgi:hypothetical protein